MLYRYTMLYHILWAQTLAERYSVLWLLGWIANPIQQV